MIVSIAVGVANLVAMISISEGLKFKTTSLLERLGSDKIIVWLQQPLHIYEYEGFKEETINKIKKVEGVKEVYPMVYKSYMLSYNNKRQSSWLTCLSEEALRSLSKYYKLLKGRYFIGNRKEVVIGYRIYKKLGLNIGDYIKIFNQKFKVVGILDEVGVYSEDIVVFVPLKIVKNIINIKYNYLIIISDIKYVEYVAKKVKLILKNERKKEDFLIYTQESLRNEVLKILGTITLILFTLSIASILIAGMVLINTMLTNIIERTREIGILRAIGAETKTIVLIFLSEILMVILISSILGIILGVILAKILPIYITKIFRVEIEPIFNLEIILKGIGISSLICILFGIYPIYKATRIKPVEVLRYE